MQSSLPSRAETIVNLSNQYRAALIEHQAAFVAWVADSNQDNERALEIATRRLEAAHKAQMKAGY